jgi:hypothetical protein
MLGADYLKRWDFMKDNLSFITLILIALILAGGVVASIIASRKAPVAATDPPART